MGGAFGVVGQHDPDHRVEHPLRPRRGEDRLPRPGATATRGRPDDPAAAGARPRRDRAGADPPRRRRPARAARRQHARRFDRAGPRRGPDAGDPLRGQQPDRPLRRRRAALLHGVPRPLRRLLRRVHPRSAGRRRGPRPVAGHDRGALRRRRDARRDHGRDDRRGPAAADRQGRRTSMSRSRADVRDRSSIASSNASEGWRRTGPDVSR